MRRSRGQLTDDDLQIFNGNVDELVGRIHEKTGMAREQIDHFISELASDTSQAVGRTRDAAMNYASQAADRMRGGYEQASGRMRDGYQRVGERVREKPAQSMLAVFGVGVIAGVVLATMLRSD